MRDKVKRFLSILMTALMLVNLMPVGALADGITSIGYKPEVAASTGNYTVYVYAKINGTLPEGSTADVNADQWYTLGKISNVFITNPNNYEMDTLFGYEVNGTSAWNILSNMTPYNNNYKIIPWQKAERGVGGDNDFGFKVCPGATDYPSAGTGKTWNLNLLVDITKITPKYNIIYKDIASGDMLITNEVFGKFQSRRNYTADSNFNHNGRKYKCVDQRPTRELVFDNVDNVKEEIFYYKDDGPVQYDLTINYRYENENGKLVEEDKLNPYYKNPYTQTLDHGTEYSVASPDIPGYTANNSVVEGTLTEDTIVTVTYTKRNDLSYTVNYYWGDDDDKKLITQTNSESNYTYNQKVDVTPTVPNGYTPMPGSGESKTITITEGTNEINFYYYMNVELTANSKTVPYNGQVQRVSGFTGAPEGADFSAIKVGASGTDVGTYTAAFADGTVDTVDATGKYIVTKAINGTLKITPVTDKVVVTITGHNDTVTYNGSEQSVEGYDVSISAPEGVNYTAADFSFSGTAKATGTNVGTYPMGLNADQFANTNGNFTNVTFNVTDGWLKIDPVETEVTVTITGHTGSHTYDGNEKTVTGYDVSIDNELYTENDFTFTGTAEAKGTDAGTYPMGLKAEQFSNNNENFKKVTFVVEDGSLTIRKRSVVLTSETASKEYDGTALEKPVVTVTGDGFVKGEVSDIKATGTITDVGSVTNEITFTKGEKFNEDNYAIEKKEGTLTITAADAEVIVTIAGNTDNVLYDGNSHSVNGYTVKSISSKLYTVDDFKFNGTDSVTQTNAGTYPMGLKAEQFSNNNENFKKVTFVVEDGSLTINKRNVVLTSETASKTYDGTALTKPIVKVTGDGFVAGEVSDIKATGSVTHVSAGEVTNTITYTEGTNFKESNYNITKTEGKLSITPLGGVVVTIKGQTKTVTYDGEEHSVFGYDATPSNKLYNPKEDMQFEGFDEDMTAKGTDAGTHTMGLTADQFHNKDNGNFTNVTFVVEKDGYVKINPRPVTLTSGSAERVYNGKPLMNETVTVGGDGFAKDEGVTYDFTGSQTDVGESENTFTFEANEGTSAKNYSFEFKFGTLKVTPFTDKVTVTITEKSGTATYDGKEHIVSGYESITADNPLYDTEDSVEENPTVMWAAKGTDVGEYPVGIKADDFKNTNGNFTNVKFVVVDGKLTITPAPITLQASSRSKTYDGTPLEADGYGFYEGNLALADDIESVILTGSQTLVGSSESQITEVVTKKGKNPKNYKFTFLPGTLTITDGTGEEEKPVDPAKVITKTHTPKDVGYNLGETVTFTISVKNIYNTPKTITLTEKANVKFSNGESVIVFNDVPAGETVTAEATYTITSADILEGVFHNTVTADFTGGGSWTAEDTVTTAELDTTLNVTKTSDVPDGQKAALGQTITYTIKVQNAGNVPYTNVKVEDPLTGLTETIETLPVGETRTFTTEYVVTEADVLKGSVLNTATATGDEIKDPKSDEPKEPNGGDEVEIKTFAPITIKPKDVTATYNGAAITGKDVEITSGKLLEGHKLSAAVIGSGVNAGSYELTLDPEKIKIVDANNKDVSEMYARTILPGKLIINKRSVLITSQSATKTYDGSALTRPAVTITGDGFVPGELAKAEATGSITNVGSTPNAIQYTTTGAFNAANYSIALSVGTLTVTEKPKPEPRRTFNLTINYVYQNGKRAAASYNRGGLKNGETFDITSPVIAGYTASETVVSGTIYNRDIKVTVIYTADGVNLDDYGVPLGLGNITMNVGDCFE